MEINLYHGVKGRRKGGVWAERVAGMGEGETTLAPSGSSVSIRAYQGFSCMVIVPNISKPLRLIPS